MNRIQIVANLYVSAVVFQTMPVRHARNILFVRECPRWNLDTRVQQVSLHNRLSCPEARRLVEMATPAVSDKSYAAAAAPKLATKSVAINTELSWHLNEAKYKTLSDIEKAGKQLQKPVMKQKENK